MIELTLFPTIVRRSKQRIVPPPRSRLTCTNNNICLDARILSQLTIDQSQRTRHSVTIITHQIVTYEPVSDPGRHAVSMLLRRSSHFEGVKAIRLAPLKRLTMSFSSRSSMHPILVTWQTLSERGIRETFNSMLD